MSLFRFFRNGKGYDKKLILEGNRRITFEVIRNILSVFSKFDKISNKGEVFRSEGATLTIEGVEERFRILDSFANENKNLSSSFKDKIGELKGIFQKIKEHNSYYNNDNFEESLKILGKNLEEFRKVSKEFLNLELELERLAEIETEKLKKVA